MATVHDVAAAIIREHGPMTAMKLQKLCYFAGGCHLAFHDRALFNEELQAWVDGPVCYELYRHHRGRYTVSAWPEGHEERLSADEFHSVRAALTVWGHLDGDTLSLLTHQQWPWMQARQTVPEGDRSNAVITPQAMHEFFGPAREALALRLCAARAAANPALGDDKDPDMANTMAFDEFRKLLRAG